MGTDVTTQCWNGGYGGTFLLHRVKCLAPVQREDPTGGARPPSPTQGASASTNTSSHNPKDQTFVSSPLGDSVMLEVTPTPAPPVRSEAPFACPSVSHGWNCPCIPAL